MAHCPADVTAAPCDNFNFNRKARDISRVRVITDSMADFRQSARVQEAGCDGLIAFAREGKAHTMSLYGAVSSAE